MKVSYSKVATRDRERQIAYLEQFSFVAADRVDRRIQEHVDMLETFPYMGRAGVDPKTRVLAIHHTDLVAVYRIFDDHIRILRLMHGAQNWPGRF